MKFRNYCVVVMGDTKGVFNEIEKISDDKPNILDARGIVIATFSSALDVKELTDWFKVNDRSFFVFDLDPELSGYNITKKEIHDGLFGFLATMDKDYLEKKAFNLMSAIEDAKIIHENSKKNKQKDKSVNVKTVIKTRRLTESEIESLTPREREEIMNKIIDNGVENMTEYDKKILPLLVK
jgi:hypothetical protein